MKDTITISIDLELDMTPEEFFVDGIPENWTIKDVVKFMRQDASSASRLIDEWCLDPQVKVYVHRKNPYYENPHYVQEEVLFEEFKQEKYIGEPYLNEQEVVFK